MWIECDIEKKKKTKQTKKQKKKQNKTIEFYHDCSPGAQIGIVI